VVALGLLSFPYVAAGLTKAGQPRQGSYSQAATEVSAEQVTLTVHNMTCGGCALTVQKSLAALDGVISTEATFEPPQAVVTYDPNKVSVVDLINATSNAGYPSEIQTNEEGIRHEKN
jgi:mercuric transport protein